MIIDEEQQPLFSEQFAKQLKKLKSKKLCFPAELRLDLFKNILSNHPIKPEDVKSTMIRAMLDHDINFALHTLAQWGEEKAEKAKIAIERIENYFEQTKIDEEISFKEHSYYCFCMSAFMSWNDKGIMIGPDELDAQYDMQLRTMVRGVVQPIGKWSVKTELDDQRYAKYICHVSKTGLITVPLMNNATSFRLDKESPTFIGVRFAAIACAENVSFDGIEDCGSLKVFKHDFIHAGHIRYAVQTDVERYIESHAKLGVMLELMAEDLELQNNEILKKQVECAFFMWTHELTTSIFVRGLPRYLPKRHYLIGNGRYVSPPQLFLKLGVTVGIIPKIFSKEIETEESILHGLISTENLQTDKERVTAIMQQLHEGYKYLNIKFDDFYGRQSAIVNMLRRSPSLKKARNLVNEVLERRKNRLNKNVAEIREEELVDVNTMEDDSQCESF